MKGPRIRWRWIAVAAAIVVLGVLAVRALDGPARIAYARVGDDRTLILGTAPAERAWTRVTSLTETATEITVTVNAFAVQLGPGAVDAAPVELRVSLRDPIGSRAVLDGSTGQAVPLTTCPPPAFLAPGCTP